MNLCTWVDEIDKANIKLYEMGYQNEDRDKMLHLAVTLRAAEITGKGIGEKVNERRNKTKEG